MDRYRRRKFDASSIDQVLNAGGEDGPLTMRDLMPDLGNSPEDTYLRDLIWEQIWEALNELPEKQREVFIKNELEDKSFREMSEETGVSINTLLSRKRYAVQALRERLEELYKDLGS